ncbi:MAG: prepilin-type N-terminal cleavage/methylation domain-containing protein [Opitutae bacterium]|nr:prepilin-type N-terminal cleavage/methylation domain-containing protein [Opitutae bacterium]
MKNHPAPRRGSAAAFTLVEVMISMTIVTMVLGMAMSTYLFGLRTMYKDTQRLITNANLRYFVAQVSKETLDASEFYIFPYYTSLDGSVDLATDVTAITSNSYGTDVYHGDCLVLVTRVSLDTTAAVRQFRIYFRVVTDSAQEGGIRYFESQDYGSSGALTSGSATPLATLLNGVNLNANPAYAGSGSNRILAQRSRGRPTVSRLHQRRDHQRVHHQQPAFQQQLQLHHFSSEVTTMRRSNPRKGSALITVVMLTAIMALLTASMLKYSGSEQRSNERQRLILRSRNMTENVILYASEQITNKLYRLRSNTPMAFMGANGVSLPPDDVLTTNYSIPADVEVRSGLTTTSGLTYIDPALPANAGNPNAGLQISNSIVPIVAQSTMRHTAIGDVHTYAQQDLEVAMMPLFQFAVFYNMDMEFGPGPNMTISGPVHTNGNFIARIQTGFANTLRFTDRVTSAKGFYANTAHKGSTYMSNGGVDSGPGGTGPLRFQNPAGTITDIKSSTGIWRDHKWTSSSTPGSVAETATSQNNFRSFAMPDIGDYDETDPVKRLNGRQVIQVPESADAGGVLGTKFSRNAGLYLIVNPDATDRTGHLPDGTTVTMRARSYRAWLNRVNSDSSHTLSEIILPGQPSYGALSANVNNLPNAYRVDTSVGHNQVLRIPQGGGVDLADTGYDGPAIPVFPTLADSYFYDMRCYTWGPWTSPRRGSPSPRWGRPSVPRWPPGAAAPGAMPGPSWRARCPRAWAWPPAAILRFPCFRPKMPCPSSSAPPPAHTHPPPSRSLPSPRRGLPPRPPPSAASPLRNPPPPPPPPVLTPGGRPLSPTMSPRSTTPPARPP